MGLVAILIFLLYQIDCDKIENGIVTGEGRKNCL